MSSVKVLRSYTFSLILIAVAQSFLTTSVQAQYGASPSQTGMFFDDLRVRQANERAASSASTRDGDVVYDYSSGVYRDGQSAPMGQRNADYESAREISRPSVRSGSSAFAARSVGDYTNYAGQYTSPTGFFAPTYTSDPYLNGRRNLKVGPVNVGFGFYQGLEFNDNVNRSGGDISSTALDESPISDVISTTMLSIDANYQITKNNRLSLSTAIGFDRYLDHPEIAPYGNGGYVLNVLPGSTIAFDIKAGPVFLTIYNRFSVRPAARNDFSLSQNQTFGVFQNDSGIAANWRINSAWTLSMNYMHSYSDALSTTTSNTGTGNFNFDEFSRVTDSLHGSLTYSPNGTWVAGIEGGSTVLEYANDFNADGVLNNLGAFVVLPVGSTTYLRAAAGAQVFEFNTLPTQIIFPNPMGDPTPSGRTLNSGDQNDLSSYYYSLTISNQLNSRVSQAFSLGHEAALNLTSNFITADYANYGLSFVAWKGSRITLSGYVEDAEASGGNFAQDIFQYGGDFHIAHRLTSHLQLGVGYHYGHTDPSIGSEGLVAVVPFTGDFIQQAFNIDLTYVLSSKATVNLGYRYMVTDVSGNPADNARSFNQNRFVLGFNYNF